MKEQKQFYFLDCFSFGRIFLYKSILLIVALSSLFSGVLVLAGQANQNDPPSEPQVWRLSNESRAEIKVGFTFGNHHLVATGFKGEIKGHSIEDAIGEIVVLLDQIKEGSPELECHLHEALGLNYEKSQYPKKHACNEENKLPTSGENSVVYPDIRLKIDHINSVPPNKLRIHGVWIIHGVRQEARDLGFEIVNDEKIPAREKSKEGALPGTTIGTTQFQNLKDLHVKGKTSFSLKVFGVVVKNAFIVSVSDNVLVDFDLNFQR